MFSEDSILHGGVKTLTRTRQVRPFPGPCGLVASLVSVFHVQNVSFSSGVHTNSSALGMRLLFAMMLLRPAFRRLIKPQVQPCKFVWTAALRVYCAEFRVPFVFYVFNFICEAPWVHMVYIFSLHHLRFQCIVRSR